MAAQNRVKPIVLVSIDSASLTSSYQPFNSAGLDGACFMLRFMNVSTQAIVISYDGVRDSEVILSNTDRTFNFQNNAQPTAWTALVPKGLVLYIKGTAGTGTIYMSGYYVQAS